MDQTISDVIRQAAARYGENPDVWLKTAGIESSGNPNDVNPNSHATGLFQFIPKTWQKYGNGANPTDPAANADAAMRFAHDNSQQFQQTFGRPPTPGEVYLMHQQGATGAAKLLQNPDAPASSLVGLQAVQQNGGNPNMTGRDFANLWTSRFDTPGANPAQAAAAQGPSTDQTAPQDTPTTQPQTPDAPSPLTNAFAAAGDAFQKLANPRLPKRTQQPGGGVVLSA